MTIATAIFLIASARSCATRSTSTRDVINIQTVGLILMIAGGAGLALSLLYELVRQGRLDATGTRSRSAAAATTTRPPM